MNLHRALDKLADGSERRSEAEERDLGGSICYPCHRVSSCWSSGLCQDLVELLHARSPVRLPFDREVFLLILRFSVSLGTGKPLVLRDDSSVRRARILL